MAIISIVPGGQWGSALAEPLRSNGHDVRIWREGDAYASLTDSEVLLLAPPASVYRSVLQQALTAAPDALVISATKGLEQGTALRCSQVHDNLRPEKIHAYVALSGPSFAHNIAEHKPAAVVLAGSDEERVAYAQQLLTTSYFRTVTSSDVVGTELGGALKNILAILAGISDGLNLGESARAALISTGLEEIVHLAAAEGAKAETLYGLSGLGDIVLSCTSSQSRNYTAGKAIAESRGANRQGRTVEGLHTAEHIHILSQKHPDIAMPAILLTTRLIRGEYIEPAKIYSLFEECF